WKDGRVGTFRGLRTGAKGYGATVFGSKGIAPSGGYGGYEPLVLEICKFFQTGKPPVSAEETVELFAFMEAADESKRPGGVPVTTESVMAKAHAQIGQPRKSSDQNPEAKKEPPQSAVPSRLRGPSGEVNAPPARGERPTDKLKVGDPAPDFTLPDLTGK